MGCNKEKKSDLCVKQDIFTLLRTGHFHFALTVLIMLTLIYCFVRGLAKKDHSGSHVSKLLVILRI